MESSVTWSSYERYFLNGQGPRNVRAHTHTHMHTHLHVHLGCYDDALCDESGQAQKRWARAGFHGRAKIFIVWKWAFVREVHRCVYSRRLRAATILFLSLSLLNAVKHGETRVKTIHYIPESGVEERERERGGRKGSRRGSCNHVENSISCYSDNVTDKVHLRSELGGR